MNKPSWLVAGLCAGMLVAAGCRPPAERLSTRGRVRVAAASDLNVALGELIARFAASNNVDVSVSYGSSGTFYASNETKPLLLLADGAYLQDQARADHLGGNQWGMMNETGRYPGQAWLWLYTMWYQVPPYNSATGALGVSAANADLGVVLTVGVLSLLLLTTRQKSISKWSTTGSMDEEVGCVE